MSDDYDDRPVYSVNLSPLLDGKSWSGAVDVFLEEYLPEDDCIDERTEKAMRQCAGMLMAAFVAMEDNEDILKAVGEYYQRMYFDHGPMDETEQTLADLQRADKEFDSAENKPQVSFDGNVIKLKFDTPTGGSA